MFKNKWDGFLFLDQGTMGVDGGTTSQELKALNFPLDEHDEEEEIEKVNFLNKTSKPQDGWFESYLHCNSVA